MAIIIKSQLMTTLDKYFWVKNTPSFNGVFFSEGLFLHVAVADEGSGNQVDDRVTHHLRSGQAGNEHIDMG